MVLFRKVLFQATGNKSYVMNYSYIRDTFNQYKPDNCILSIQLSLDGFSFFVSDKDLFNKPLFFLSRKFITPGLQSLIRELENFNELENRNFFKIFAIIHTHEFCLVPEKVYNHKTGLELMKLSHPVPDNSVLCTSGISSINARVAFLVPEDLINMLRSKFDNAIILHSVCPSVNYGIMKYGTSCIIHHFGGSISVAVFDNSSLKFFNIFSVSDENDTAYYILNALRTCRINPAVVKVYISGNNPENFPILTKYISKPVFYLPELIETSPSDFPYGMLFNHLEGYNCVLSAEHTEVR